MLLLLLDACRAKPTDDSVAPVADDTATTGRDTTDTAPPPDTADTPDTHDTAETDSTDTAPGDSGDTGVPPTGPTVTVYGGEAGLPAGEWFGLSVDADGVVWGAMNAGLVRFDPVTGTAHTYTQADGLLEDAVSAVLAASDGTVWVGHIADSVQQGEQVSVAADGTLSVLLPVDYTESTEIAAVFRLAEEPWGKGVGDVWMGTNEGLCVYDTHYGVFAEHAHPTHPHGYTRGVAFTADGDVWNGDEYQLSRWRYSNDGDLSPSADLFETIPPWPAMPEEPIDIADLTVDGDDLWIASTLWGVARLTVAPEAGASVTELFAEPTEAQAIRADGVGNVWIGTSTGLWIWDGAAITALTVDGVPADGVQEIAVDPTTSPPVVWLGTSTGLVRVQGVPEGP